MPKYLPAVIVVAFSMILVSVLLMRTQHRPWTSEVPEAIAELELGLEAQRRYYGSESIDHFDKALDLDPEFAAAMIFRLQSTRFAKNERWHELFEKLRDLPFDRLSSRETFLVRYGIAILNDERREAEKILESYLGDYPDDGFALEIRCDRLWRSEQPEEAELCYTDLLATEPNWVQAENRLGYLAMGQGRFKEAEEHFRTYRFIAPDQANPHDSLGDLLILLGRYDEAEIELEEALAIRPDFCNSYRNLANLVLYARQTSRAAAIVERAATYCSEEFAESLKCSVEFSIAFIEDNWQELTRSAAKSCVRQNPGLLWMVHRGAVLTGELRMARKIEKAVAGIEYKLPTAMQLHLKGVRLCSEGKMEGACSSFEGADRQLGFQTQDEGMLKLFNRLNWAHACALGGEKEKAEKLLTTVHNINPDLSARYRRGEIAMPRP